MAPPVLPLLRRPGANWALVAIMLGLLGTITWGILSALAVPALMMAWRSLQERPARNLCPGVRMLVGVGLLATVLGIGVGLWSLSTIGHSPSSAIVSTVH